MIITLVFAAVVVALVIAYAFWAFCDWARKGGL